MVKKVTHWSTLGFGYGSTLLVSVNLTPLLLLLHYTPEHNVSPASSGECFNYTGFSYYCTTFNFSGYHCAATGNKSKLVG